MMVGLLFCLLSAIYGLCIKSIVEAFSIQIDLFYIKMLTFYIPFIFNGLSFSIVYSSVWGLALKKYTQVSGIAGAIFNGGYVLLISFTHYIVSLIPGKHLYLFIGLMITISLINVIAAMCIKHSN